MHASKNDFVLSLRKIVYVFIGLSNDYQLMIDTTNFFSVLKFNFTQLADIYLNLISWNFTEICDVSNNIRSPKPLHSQ